MSTKGAENVKFNSDGTTSFTKEGKEYILNSEDGAITIESTQPKYKIGDTIDIYTSEGEYQGEDGRWTIVEIIERPKYGPAYNLKNNKGARLTLPLSQVDNDPNKYRLYNPDN